MENNGEWIKEQCKLTYEAYKQKMQGKNIFTLDKEAKKLNDKINYYRSICPHDFKDSPYCIYCGILKSN